MHHKVHHHKPGHILVNIWASLSSSSSSSERTISRELYTRWSYTSSRWALSHGDTWSSLLSSLWSSWWWWWWQCRLWWWWWLSVIVIKSDNDESIWPVEKDQRLFPENNEHCVTQFRNLQMEKKWNQTTTVTIITITIIIIVIIVKVGFYFKYSPLRPSTISLPSSLIISNTFTITCSRLNNNVHIELLDAQ